MSGGDTTVVDTSDVVLSVDNAENIEAKKNVKDSAKAAKRKEKESMDAEKAKKIHEKNIAVTGENTKLKSEIASFQRKYDSLKKELEQSQKQTDKLQQVNKLSVLRLAEERKLRLEVEMKAEQQQLMLAEQSEKQKELHEKFENSIQEIQGKLEHHAKAEQAAEESSAMKEKIEKVLADVNSRHEAINKIIEEKDVEIKDANERSEKLRKLCLELDNNNKELLDKVEIMTKHRDALQESLNLYSDKFSGFQKTMNETTEMVGEYKKQIMLLKTENQNLTAKLTKNTAESLQIMDKFKTVTAELEKERKQKEALANLCQTLRAGKDVSAKPETSEDTA